MIAQTGRYDHCNMTVMADGPAEPIRRFGDLLLAMDYADPEVRPLLDLEGLNSGGPAASRATARWRRPSTTRLLRRRPEGSLPYA